MTNPTRCTRRAATLALLAALAAPAVHGQSAAANPNAGKPLRLILPVGAGSGVDTIIRAAAPALGKVLDQTIVIENLPGAGGLTGTSALVKAAPDGLTLAVLSNNHAVNPSIYKKMPFDPIKDVLPISVVGETPFVLVVNPNTVPAKNAKELATFLQARPGQYNYGSSGNGTIIHLATEMFTEAAKVDVKHIPYKGVGPQVADIIGGQVEMGVVAVPAVVGQIKSGMLRPIGIMGKRRVASLPDVPTMAEQGYPAVDVGGWFAFVAPVGLPATQVKLLHDAVVAAFDTSEVKAAMAKQDNQIHPTSPDDAQKFFQSEMDRYAQIVKRADIKMD